MTAPIRSSMAAGLALAVVAMAGTAEEANAQHGSGHQVHVNRPGLVARMVLGLVGAARTRG